MAIQKLTASDFANVISKGVNSRDKTIDTRIGPVRDLFIDPHAAVMEQQNNRMVYLNNALSMRNASNIVPDDLDEIVYNEGLVRFSGSPSIVTVTFYRVKPPTSNISVPANFPLSSPATGSSGDSVLFRTVESAVMYSALSSAYYNADEGRYELNVLASSIVRGSESRVGANSITVMRRNFPDFDGVMNKEPTTSGVGVESNADLAERYMLHIKGSKPSTPDGIRSHVLDNFSSVEDLFVVYGNNTYLTREESDAGAVDIWIKGASEATRTYNTFYTGVGNTIVLDRQPVMRINSVTTSSSGGVSYVEGTDFELVVGQGENSYSNVGIDGIRFLDTGSRPEIGADLSIDFVYNGLMGVLDSYFNQPAFYVMGSDNLFRWALPKDIYIETSLKVNVGSPATIVGLVKSAILSYINGLPLGADVNEFDIDRIVATVYGVDNWTYSILDVFGGSGISDINVGPNQYARLLTSNIVINLV
jgi:hypothetical protein